MVYDSINHLLANIDPITFTFLGKSYETPRWGTLIDVRSTERRLMQERAVRIGTYEQSLIHEQQRTGSPMIEAIMTLYVLGLYESESVFTNYRPVFEDSMFVHE